MIKQTQDSQPKEKLIRPYWNDTCQSMSANLWLPTAKDNFTNVLSQSNPLSSPTLHQSWFSANILQNPQPKPLNLLNTVKSENSQISVIRTRKIRLYPNANQRILFRRWLGASRFVYNRTIDYLKSLRGRRPTWTDIATYTILPELPDWAKEIPFKIKKMAVKEACDAHTAAKKKYLITGEFSEFAYRNRKDPYQTCYIPKSAVVQGGIYPKLAGKMHYGEALPEEFQDCELSWQQGRWFLCVPFKTMVQMGENQARIVALDPGIRNFLSFFSPELAGVIGAHDFGRMVRLCQHLDKLLSKIAKSPNKKQRYRMRKAARRMRWKIRDLRDEIHAKAARFLVNHFDIILIPEFETSQMAKRGQRKLSSKSVRSMMTWAHFIFKQRLKAVAIEAGKIVIEVNEAYTSKTCSWSGEMVNLGSSEIIYGSDGTTMHRDLNGARGIFLRALAELPSLKNFQCELAKDAHRIE
jgi:putative transposase